MKYKAPSKDIFISNRKKFTAEMAPGSLAIFHSNEEYPRSGDQAFMFRQSPDFFYLTGIDQEASILLLFPDSPEEKYKEVLFLKKTNDHIKVWEGHKYTMEEASAASGITEIHWLDNFDNIANLLMRWCEKTYINGNENDRANHEVLMRDERKGNELTNKFPSHQYLRAAPIMKKLRAVKSELEIDLIRKACNITEKAFRRVLGFVKEGVWEHEIEAEIIHEFIRNRATGHAYTPIVASGESACILHYNDNNRQCKAGDVILFDFGAEYANYNADLSRSIPVSGKFSARQKSVYNAVHRVQKNALKLLVPGTTIHEYHLQVGELMTKELVDLKLISMEDVKKQNPKWPAYKKYFMHGTSHHLGLDVHDLGGFHVKLKEGMVFTCEPGIYIPEEGLGIRLENDVVVRKSAVEDLMANIPIDAEEIESLMQA